MQFFDETLGLVAVAAGAVTTSILLGNLLHRYGNNFYKSSLIARFAFLIALGIAVGASIWVWFLSPYVVYFALILSVGLGVLFLWGCGDLEKIEDSDKGPARQ